MRVLVTGIAGFMGSHIADAMLERGHQVIGIDNLIGGDMKNVPEDAIFYRADLNDYNTIQEYFKGVDVVYHCAATAYEGLSVFSPFIVTKHIVGASTAAITASVAHGVKRFINMSSMSRYGSQRVPFRETRKTRPQDPYAIGKVAVEDMLINLAETHGMEYVNIVPHNIIGPRQKYDDPFRNVASIMINLMLQGRQPVIYGDGSQKRCFSFMQDVIDPMVVALDAPISGETINVGPDKEFITIKKLAQIIAKLLEFDLEPVYFDDRPKEVRFANCSADKARKLLGYEAKTSLKDGLEKMIEYIDNEGPKPFTYHLPVEIQNQMTPRTWTKRYF